MKPSRSSSDRIPINPTRMLANQIRSKAREQLFSKIREQSMMKESVPSYQQEVSTKVIVCGFPNFVQNPHCPNISCFDIQQLTSLIQNRKVQKNPMNQKQLETVLKFLYVNIVSTNCKTPSQKINALLVLFHETLHVPSSTAKFIRVVKRSIDLKVMVEKINQLLQIMAEPIFQNLLLLLIDVLRLGSKKLTKILGKLQPILIEKYGLEGQHLLIMFRQLQLDQSVQVSEELIKHFLSSYSNASMPLDQNFCLSLVIILEKYWKNGGSTTSIPNLLFHYIYFISSNLQSWCFASSIKSQLLNLLHHIVCSDVEINCITSLFIDKQNNLSEQQKCIGKLFAELLQRAQYDYIHYNKCISLFCICQIIKKSTYSQLLSIAVQYPSLIEILGEGLQYMEANLVIEIVGAFKMMMIATSHATQRYGESMHERISQLIQSVQCVGVQDCSEGQDLAQKIRQNKLEED